MEGWEDQKRSHTDSGDGHHNNLAFHVHDRRAFSLFFGPEPRHRALVPRVLAEEIEATTSFAVTIALA